MPSGPVRSRPRPVPELFSEGRLGTHRVSGQAVRFLSVGAVATVVDIALFNLLHFGLAVAPLLAKTGSTVVAGMVAFFGNRELTFGDQSGRSVRRQAAAFAAVSVAGLALSLLPLAFARYGLGLTGAVALNAAANVVGLAMATAFRFYGCRRWVFPPAVAAVSQPEVERRPVGLAA